MNEQTRELITDLVNAVRNRDQHNQASYSCGTACCIAGEKVARDYPKVRKLLPYFKMSVHGAEQDWGLSPEEVEAWEEPWGYARDAYGISALMSDLLFDPDSTAFDHVLGILILELGIEIVELVDHYSECSYSWLNRSRLTYIDLRTKEIPKLTILLPKLTLQETVDKICEMTNNRVPPITQQLLDEVLQCQAN